MSHRLGVARFTGEVYPGLRTHFTALAESQTPTTLFVTCSDSRVDPALITQSLPGDLLVLRNVGNFVPAHGCDPASAAVVEYALGFLKIPRIVVCGHSNCGAMAGLLHPETIEHLAAVARWVEQADAVRARVAHIPPEQRWLAAVRTNVAYQIEMLKTHPIVAAALQDGLLHIEGWMYDIGDGRIDVLVEEGVTSE